ncbi:MAG TPA: GntR family transcriptional regulator [Gemmatimonadaceae bacterium]|nr:GntR family transcriptional regulator [Gemmatimonadaceae bacterium]
MAAVNQGRPVAERQTEITQVLRQRIFRGLQAGTLARGNRLPSARELAGDFRIDHRVVLAAYRDLAGEGLVELRPRGGIYLSTDAGTGDAIPLPAVSWIVDIFEQAVARQIPVAELAEWVRRSVETLRLRAVAVEATSDQVAGLCRELCDDYGLDASGLDVAELDDDRVPAAARNADVVVTTAAHANAAGALADRLGVPCIVAAVRPDLIGGEWRMLLRKPVYVVVDDPRYVPTLQRFFAHIPEAAENMRVLVVGEDDMGTIPDGAPTYVTRGARARLGETRIPGRILPTVHLFSAESARALITFIVRANLDALTAVRKRRAATDGR